MAFTAPQVQSFPRGVIHISIKNTDPAGKESRAVVGSKVIAKPGDVLDYSVTMVNKAQHITDSTTLNNISINTQLVSEVTTANKSALQFDIKELKAQSRLERHYKLKVDDDTASKNVALISCFTADNTRHKSPQAGCDKAELAIESPKTKLPSTGINTLSLSISICLAIITGYCTRLYIFKRSYTKL